MHIKRRGSNREVKENPPTTPRSRSLPPFSKLRSFLPKKPSPLHNEFKPKDVSQSRRSSVASQSSAQSQTLQARRSASEGSLSALAGGKGKEHLSTATTSLSNGAIVSEPEIIDGDHHEGSYELRGFTRLLGGIELLDDAGKGTGKKIESFLETGKIVGLYIGAGGWSEPCNYFSSQLSAFLRSNAPDFCVVYLSLDRTMTEMAEHIRGTGFLCFPHEAPSTIAASGTLSKAERVLRFFNYHGIPKLLILGAHGEVVSNHGRAIVQWSGEGALEAWKRGESGLYACFLKTWRFWR